MKTKLFRVNTEYWMLHVPLLQGHLRNIISLFACPTKVLRILPDILQKGNLVCEAVQRGHVCTSCERHKSSMHHSPLLDLSLVKKLIILQSSFHSMRWAPQWIASYLIVFPAGKEVAQVAFSQPVLRSWYSVIVPHPSHQQSPFTALQTKSGESLKA